MQQAIVTLSRSLVPAWDPCARESGTSAAHPGTDSLTAVHTVVLFPARRTVCLTPLREGSGPGSGGCRTRTAQSSQLGETQVGERGVCASPEGLCPWQVGVTHSCAQPVGGRFSCAKVSSQALSRLKQPSLHPGLFFFFFFFYHSHKSSSESPV